ncbi:hypothetical protein [Cellulomonas palmilytica]|uniref:hypothetical protein n=1 Tax=Cellulomonas palmilytica TaxID=2608402 RepID=UPI001F4838DE|nr:hypothetical protein [Cellulomonas palmilytica]UJP40386.1 hypothetical protein F1D97_02305 [Cellulomonas palmilytica]
MTEPQEPRRPAATARETFTHELRRAGKDTAVGFLEDVLYGLLVLVVLVALVGGGAALGSATGIGAVVGGLLGAGLFAVAAIAFLVKGGAAAVRELRGERHR